MGLSTFSKLLPGVSALFLTGFRDRRALENFRNRQLRVLLRHACHVPYYRQLFARAGVEPGAIKSTEDLTAIPISYKRDLQPLTATQSCIAGVDPARLIVRRSSGTTGAPSSIRRSWWEERLLQ